MKVADSIESIIFYLLAGIVGVFLYRYSQKHKYSPMILVGVHAVFFIVAHGVLISSIAKRAWISSGFDDPVYMLESEAFVAFSVASFIGAFMLVKRKIFSLRVPSWARISYTIFNMLGFVILVTGVLFSFADLTA